MSGRRCNISFIIVLVSLFSFQAYSQQTNVVTGLAEDNSGKALFKPVLHYSIGSSFIAAPRLGTLSSISFSTAVSVPLTPRLSVEGGIMTSYYYSAPFKSDNAGFPYGSFNGLSVYGSAIYQFTPQFTVYGSAINQIAGTSPFYTLPKSSYTIGSSYNFGDFSIGVSFQMSSWDNFYTPFPVSGPRRFFSPY